MFIVFVPLKEVVGLTNASIIKEYYNKYSENK